MKRSQINPLVNRIIKALFLTGSFAIILFSLVAFNFKRYSDDFLKQLGISKPTANEKIVNSIFTASLDLYDLTKAKKILLADRSAVTTELLAYIKIHVKTPAVNQQYQTMRNNAKPKPHVPQTPEEMRKENIENIKKMIAESEANLKKANTVMKPVFENTVKEGKKQLAAAEDANNKQFKSYEKGYPQLLKDVEEQNKSLLVKWEKQYPEDIMAFIKPLLVQFLTVTENIDFDAALINKNGKKLFANPEYEKKDGRWKMSFRAGKEVVIPARNFVQKWLNELN